MKLIIDIPEEVQRNIDTFKGHFLCGYSFDLMQAIKNGTPLDSDYDKLMTISQQLAFENEELRERLSAVPEREKEEWIPVSERLPEIHQDVLLSLRSLDVEVGFRAETEPYFYCHGADGCYVEPQNVLAWQPLPEPYKAESEDKE